MGLVIASMVGGLNPKSASQPEIDAAADAIFADLNKAKTELFVSLTNNPQVPANTFVASPDLFISPDKDPVIENNEEDPIEGGDGDKKTDKGDEGVSNAQIASKFASDVGVKVVPAFNDVVAQAKEKLDEESYKDAINLFHMHFQAQNPKLGGDLFSSEEKEYLFYMTMELLANNYQNPRFVDLKTSIGEFGIEAKPYLSMANESYKSILFCIVSNEDIAKSKENIAKSRKNIEQLRLKSQELYQGIVKAELFWEELSLNTVKELTNYYNDINSGGNLAIKQEFAETLKNSINLYGTKCPQELTDLREKVEKQGRVKK